MAVSFVFFEQFITDYANKVHDLIGTAGSSADTAKVMLSNTAPDVTTDAVKADITDITNANGYSGGVSVANVGTRTTLTLTVTGTNVTITASGGAVGPFQYVVLYNDTPTSPADPLIGYWDLGVAVTLQDGESFTTRFNGGGASGTILTVAA